MPRRNKQQEKPENQQQFEIGNRRVLKQREFLARVTEYSGDFFDYHKWRARTFKTRLKNVKVRQEHLSKVVVKDGEKEDRERIDALKDKKFEIYADMIKKAKKERIIQILEDTDTFLKELARKVLQTKRKSNPNFVVNEEVAEWLSKQSEDYDINKSTLMDDNYTKFYYNLTHTNLEEIVQQPTLLSETCKLKPYQMVGLKWMVSLYNNKLNGILADEMGLGKTIQTIALLCYIMEFKQNYGPFLIVVPLTTLSNWVMEFNKWAKSIKLIVYKGTPPQRKTLSHTLRNTKWNVCLTTYEYIMKDKSDLNRFQWQYVIVDEGHKMKNQKSKFVQTLGESYKSEYRLLLTGTPLQNNLPELWSLLNFLLPDVFGSAQDFEKWFNMPLKKYGAPEKDADLSEESKHLLVHRFHNVLRPFLLRRDKKEVESELPNKVEYVIKVDMSSWQKLLYTQIEEKQCTSLDPSQGKVGKKALMNIMMQKRKVCDHPYLFLDDSRELCDEIFRCSGKFELLERILPKLLSCGHRVLIFTQMTRLMDIFEDFFDYKSKLQPHQIFGT
jgi:ATP-dependent helicase STH1/SNF2